jgi:hypothetical protein
MPACGVYRRRARERFKMDASALARRHPVRRKSFLFSFLSDDYLRPASKGIRKLGVLGAITEPGDLCLYVIPHPHDLRPDMKEAGREPFSVSHMYIILIYP